MMAQAYQQYDNYNCTKLSSLSVSYMLKKENKCIVIII